MFEFYYFSSDLWTFCTRFIFHPLVAGAAAGVAAVVAAAIVEVVVYLFLIF